MSDVGSTSEPTRDGEALLHFLYQFPVAVLRMDAKGRVDLMNPRAAALLQDLALPCVGAHAGRDVLAELAPELARRLDEVSGYIGSIASRQAVRRADHRGGVRHLALTLQVVSPGSLMLTLEDLTELHDALASRREVQRRYHDLLEVIPAGVVMHGAGSEIIACNAEAARLLGLSIDQLMGRIAVDPRWRFLRDDGSDMPVPEYPVNRVLSTGQPLENVVLGIQRSDAQSPIWVMVNAVPMLSSSREHPEICVSFTDITELKTTERRLHQSEERYRLALRGSNDAPWDWDLARESMYYSPRWWEMIGRAPDEPISDPAAWGTLIHPQDRDSVLSVLRAALEGGQESFECEYRLMHADGSAVDVLTRAFIQRDANGHAVRISGTNLDLRERNRAAAEIQRLAYHDALTGLPNRRRLLERLQDVVGTFSRSTHHGALLFIDLDRFKELNDTRGHACGDQLLQHVASRLVASVREVNTTARLGGDEFVVLLDYLNPDRRQAVLDVESVGERVLGLLRDPVELASGPYRGSASIGITLFGPGNANVEDLLMQADLAMYQAKALGRGRIHFFDESMQRAIEQRVSLETDLRTTLEHGGLLLHLQPQVRRPVGMIGAEALVRWSHPTRGIIYPDAFIPVAEESGLILALGRWVLHEACRVLAAWAGDPAFASMTMSVNVSVHQLHDAGFVDDVLEVLRQTGADPARLKLEVTESALAKDMEQVIDKMLRLRQHGVSFALDDFGTGYSSLSYLKRLPLDLLKIDGSFVQGVTTDASDATLVRTIISLAREFGIAVIAEGVETHEQRDFLEQAGCLAYQGYLFGRPAPRDTFEAAVRRQATLHGPTPVDGNVETELGHPGD